MGDIYFDNSADAIIDDWIKDVDTNSLSEAPARVVGMAGDSRNNFGIGFDAKGKKSGNQQSSDQSNSLIDSIKKKNAKKKISNKDLHFEQHGVVDDVAEMSKTSIVSGKNKKPHKQIERPHDKSIEKNTPDALMPPGGDPNAAREKPKRIKTRSKQKNIRRDKRALEHKPDHLQIGSKNYKGRPITSETRKVLGLEQPQNKRQKKKHVTGRENAQEHGKSKGSHEQEDDLGQRI